MPKQMIFHHPLPLVDQPRSGSQLRPVRMVEAFRTLGYHIELVAGYAKERRKAVQRVKSQLEKGHVFDFAYSESSTTPTLLTEPHHLPTHPTLDFGFFRLLRQHSIPVGLFYRDIVWRFEQYKLKGSLPKRVVAKLFYWYDWLRYRQLLDHLFLPTLEMRTVLPTKWRGKNVSALPPGCCVEDVARSNHHPNDILRLFYVGGIRPSLYDLSPVIEVVSSVRGVHFTICCREKDWEICKSYYGRLGDNVTVIHAAGRALEEYYKKADLFFNTYSDNPYLDFALPTKVLETLGHGVPIVTWSDTRAARFVEDERTGWVVRNKEEAKNLLRYLQKHPEEVAEKKTNLQVIRESHTWESRAKEAAEILGAIR